MKFKLDENLGHRARALLVAAGHDVATVHEENRRCACEVKNPKGSCCLGDVTRVESAIVERVAMVR